MPAQAAPTGTGTPSPTEVASENKAGRTLTNQLVQFRVKQLCTTMTHVTMLTLGILRRGESGKSDPILCAHLLRRVDERLIEMLSSLTSREWDLQTVAPLWKVRDVAAHLLDTSLRKLSSLGILAMWKPWTSGRLKT
jgi:hypothetical protein